MTTNDYQKADLLVAAIEQALILQKTATDTLAQVDEASKALAKTPQKLSDEVRLTIANALSKPANEASLRMAEKLEYAISAAGVAANSMTQLGRRISLKLFVLMLAYALVGSLLIVACAFYFGITPWQMQARREERAVLDDALARLKRRGADLDVRNCTDARNKPRFCVRVDPGAGSFEDDFMALKP